MGERLKMYLKRTGALVERLSEEAKEQGTEREAFRERVAREKAELLVQISFFQHERLIHLIVTVTFALLTVLSIFAFLVLTQIGLLVLSALLIILLVPYIRHYYILENGVQKLYTYYDRLVE